MSLVSILTRRYSRRESFGLIAGLLLLARCGSDTRRNNYDRCSLSLYQVQAGQVSPQDYLDERFRCLPEVVEARKAGMLKGFVYNPSDRELEDIAKELCFAHQTCTQQELQYATQSAKDGYKERSKIGSAATISEFTLFGQKVPLYVVFAPHFLYSSDAVNNDADVRSTIIHELKHVKDFYKGISLDDIHLSSSTISPKTFNVDFLVNLWELRGEYEELKDMFRERVEKGSVSVSSSRILFNAIDYSNYWRLLESYPANELEDRVRKLQFKEFSGIVPERIGEDEILIRFNLFGREEMAELRIK